MELKVIFDGIKGYIRCYERLYSMELKVIFYVIRGHVRWN